MISSADEKKYFDDSFIVGYLFNALESIVECLSAGESSKASTKVYESIRFVKEHARKNVIPEREIANDENTTNP